MGLLMMKSLRPPNYNSQSASDMHAIMGEFWQMNLSHYQLD